MSHHHRPTVQPRLGTLYRPCDGADAGVMNADRVNPLAAGRLKDGMPMHCCTGTGDDLPNGQVRKARPQGTLSGSIPRVPGGTLWVMNAHTQEPPAHAPDSETYRYLLSHCGPLLPQPSAPDGANPWPGRPKP